LIHINFCDFARRKTADSGAKRLQKEE